jgi:hypothetical protein
MAKRAPMAIAIVVEKEEEEGEKERVITIAMPLMALATGIVVLLTEETMRNNLSKVERALMMTPMVLLRQPRTIQ